MATPGYSQRQRILKQAAEWFVELESEHCDVQLQQQFEQWLAESPAHRQAYDEMQSLWGNMDTLKTHNVAGLSAARPRRWSNGKTLLSALVLAGLLGGWWQDYNAPVTIYRTGIGERRSVELADGSHLQLNTDSRLQARLSWLRRDIELQQGEAMFSVAHQAWRPFTVHADNLHISDIGTVFNVRRQDGGVQVAVLDGEVELRAGRGWFGEALKAGFSRQLDRNGHWQPIEKANPEHTLAWTNGQLLFDHTPLAEVISELERYHPVHFALADPQLAHQTLSGRFDAADFKPFLQAMERILPVRIQRQKQTIVLYRR